AVHNQADLSPQTAPDSPHFTTSFQHQFCFHKVFDFNDLPLFRGQLSTVLTGPYYYRLLQNI
ncbi:MAG: hypothetical protein ACK6EB_37030, partial [Planctomyces sp.]